MIVDIYTEFWFGKYKGQCVGDIINDDWSYVEWAEENVEGFALNGQAANLLRESQIESDDEFDYWDYVDYK